MLSLFAAVFAASVLGSLHCAGMCGAFLAIAIGDDHDRVARQAAYHLGRLITYTSLGLAAGAAGKLLNIAGALAGIRPIAAILAGSIMVVFGIVTLLRMRGVSLSRMPLPQAWTNLLKRGHELAARRSPNTRALMIGLLTTLLPCGWLYAFAVTAAGTGSPALGAATMAAFWLGTLPALVALGMGLQRALGPLGKKIPAITAILLVIVGLHTLVARASIEPLSLINHMVSCCENK